MRNPVNEGAMAGITTMRVTPLRLAAVAAGVGLAIASLVVFGWTFAAVVAAAGCAVLVVVTVTDLERRLVLNVVVVPALVVALVVQTARDPSIEWIVAALAGGAFYLVLALIYPAGLGMGDVKLAAFLGAWLGRDVVIAFFATSILGLLPSLYILVRMGVKGRKVGIPYAPFLALGGLIALFWGDRVMDAWLG